MSDVTFTPARFNPPKAAAASSGVSATVTHPPPATAALTTGNIVRGTVLGANAQGQVLVKTEYGVLNLQTKAQLTAGNQVILQVRVAGSELHTTILRIDGNGDAAPRQGGESGARGLAARGLAAQGLAGAAEPEDSAGERLLRAVVESAGKASGNPQDGLLRVGREVQLRILAIQTTDAAMPGQKPAPLPGGPGPAASGTPFRIEGLVLPPTGDTLSRIETAQGILRLAVQTALPPGARVVLDLLPAPNTAPGMLPEDADTLDLLPQGQTRGTARGWPALEETLRLLQPGDQIGAGLGLGSHPLPRPGPRLASAMLFFMAALRGGEFGAWLSSTAAQSLERAGRGDLLQRLQQDFGRLGQLATESAGGDWRGYLIPVVDSAVLGQVRFFVRKPEDEPGNDPADSARPTRFVVDVTMSRLGELQLDGLIREKRFDLILRSRAPLPAGLKREIAEIYQAANEAGGYLGQLVFQAEGSWDPLPIELPENPDSAVLV